MRGVMKTVLAVDDEEDILQMVEDYLVPEGYRVLKARNGKEALEMTESQRPHIILLDINMPIMGGFSVLDILRGRKGISATPVVMLTAQGQTHNILEAERLHTVDYLIKPFTLEDLLTVIRRTIG